MLKSLAYIRTRPPPVPDTNNWSFAFLTDNSPPAISSVLVGLIVPIPTLLPLSNIDPVVNVVELAHLAI